MDTAIEGYGLHDRFVLAHLRPMSNNEVYADGPGYDLNHNFTHAYKLYDKPTGSFIIIGSSDILCRLSLDRRILVHLSLLLEQGIGISLNFLRVHIP